MTPEDISLQRRIAASLSQPDYSPIQSPWQGLARVAGNLTGALRERNANRASEANAADSRSVIEALMNPNGGISEIGATQPPTMDDVSATVAGLADDPTGAAAPLAAPAPPGVPSQAPGGANPQQAIIAALANPYVSDEVRQIAGLQYRAQLEAANRRPAQPHYWETNNGSLGMIGPDGVPQIVYQDPTPRTEWITARNPDGTMTIVPMQQGGGQQPQAAPTDPSYWTPVDDEGGPTPPGSGGFP